jgi:hypothetical protein
MFRAVVPALAAVSLVLAVAGQVAAASPEPSIQPTVGGRLDGYSDLNQVVVTNLGNVPARLTLEADQVTLLNPGPYTLDPNEQVTVKYDGPDSGTVSGTFTALATPGQETGTATLVMNLKPPKPPVIPLGLFGVLPPDAPVIPALLIIAALALIVWRTKPWTLRLTRAPRKETYR